MREVTFLDHGRTAADIAHDEARFSSLGLGPETLLDQMAAAASEVAGWGAGNEAAVIRFAMAEIVRLRAPGLPSTAALLRLTSGDDPMVSKIERIVADCPKRGDIGGLAVGEFPASGRVMVPTEVLKDLLAVVRGAITC